MFWADFGRHDIIRGSGIEAATSPAYTAIVTSNIGCAGESSNGTYLPVCSSIICFKIFCLIFVCSTITAAAMRIA